MRGGGAEAELFQSQLNLMLTHFLLVNCYERGCLRESVVNAIAVKAVESKVYFTPQLINRALKELVRRGLIREIIHPEDRESWSKCLEKAGKDKRVKLAERYCLQRVKPKKIVYATEDLLVEYCRYLSSFMLLPPKPLERCIEFEFWWRPGWKKWERKRLQRMGLLR